ncbi:MAG TPA: ATP-grasp domain-containing protein [Acidocella sp.]|uniref:ATP-grasp domain-containing protein n=1 Tax=Acidocella sp. TaxID=50710 RepID=UPI002B9C49C1|nr:ATP-grasp domain-containing protein [Acidocella sp.]HVE22724.1 ATP-grasp domain-containing protein [Acidocella sp.]
MRNKNARIRSPDNAVRRENLMETTPKKIAFGRNGAWESLVAGSIDAASYSFSCVDFDRFDLETVDYAIPLQVHDAMALRRRYGEAHGKYIIADPDITALCADKLDFNKAILASDFAYMIPEIYETTKRDFPYVLKRRDGGSGEEIFVVRTEEDERRHETHLSRDSFFCQVYVPGQVEYATHMLLVNGEVLYHSTNKYVMSDEFLVKGTARQPEREMLGAAMDGHVILALTELLRSVGFNGTCCLDYKILDGRIQLMEVNPRVGFSLFRDINRYLEAYIGALEAKGGGGRRPA